MDESTGGNDREWMCIVAGGVEGARAGDEAGEVGMGMGEVTDWTGWSGGDGSGEVWRGEMHRTAFLPLIGEPPGEVI